MEWNHAWPIGRAKLQKKENSMKPGEGRKFFQSQEHNTAWSHRWLNLGNWVSTEWHREEPELRLNPLLTLKLPRNLENRMCLEDRVSKTRAAWTSPGQGANQSAWDPPPIPAKPLMMLSGTLDWHKAWWVAMKDRGWENFWVCFFYIRVWNRTNCGHQREQVTRGQ